MDQLTTELDQLRMASLTWGPISDPSAPLAVLLHGFPDTAHTWRHLGPELAAVGYRVVAPFTRGYGPDGIPADRSYHVPALMSDVLELHAALDGDARWAALVNGRLPQGGRAAVITDGGHFLQLERPDVVNARILEFLAEAS